MSAKNEVASQTVDLPSDDTLVITRVLSAPRELAWRAWTEREHIMRWLCPKDFSVMFSDGDLRVGGKWRSGIRSFDGEESVMGGEYTEITPPQRLAFSHGWEDSKFFPGHMTQIVVELEPHTNGTKMVFTQTNLPSVDSRDGHSVGWSEVIEKLDTYLHELQNSKR